MARKSKLDGIDTILAASILYYDEEECTKFLRTFHAVISNEMVVLDGIFVTFVERVDKFTKQSNEWKKETDPEKRKSMMVGALKTANELQPNANDREIFALWLDKVLELNVPMELADDALYRFLWVVMVKNQVEALDKSNVPFSERFINVPNIPDIARKDNIIWLSDMEVEEESYDDEVFTTSVSDIDMIVKPVRTNFMVICSRPGVGKSTLMLKMAIENARRGVRCMYVSLEMSEKQMRERIINFFMEENLKEHWIDQHGFMDNKKYKEEQRNVMASKKFKDFSKNMCLYINRKTDASSVLSLIEERIKSERLKIVFIDYLGLLQYAGLDEFASLRRLTKDLKSIAMRLNVLMVSASQVSRSSTQTGLFLTDLFGSTSIESDTDIVIGLEGALSPNRNVATSSINKIGRAHV